MSVPKMVDMARSPKEVEETAAMPMFLQNKYPYGLCISLCQDELEKLDVDHGDWEVGDMFHLHAFAKVTSISQSDTEDGGKNCRVELQITALGAESEDEENEEAEEKRPSLSGFHKKLYEHDED
jgi:hypothetical protein